MSRIDSLIGRLEELTRASECQLERNRGLSDDLHDLQKQMLEKEYKIEELSTRFDNSQIFLQHLASLNLRSEFLEKQLQSLETDTEVSISATSNHGIKEFRQWKENNLNWRTAETTYENLSLEYQYLSQQLKIANDYSDFFDKKQVSQVPPKPVRFVNPNAQRRHVSFGRARPGRTPSETTYSTEESLFSTDEQSSTVESIITPVVNTPKRRLMKMESFLTIPYEQQNVRVQNDLSNPALKGFHIGQRQVSSNADNTSNASNASNAGNTNRQFTLPVLTEEDEEDDGDDEKDEVETETETEIDTEFEDFNFTPRLRHFTSMPGVEESPVKDLRHFASHDTGLHRPKRYDLKDFTFAENMPVTDQATVASTPSVTTIKHSNIDDDDDDDDGSFIGESTDLLRESDTDSYGAEEVEQIDFNDDYYKKPVKETTGIKEQTMRWLKPCIPVVSPTRQGLSKGEIIQGEEPDWVRICSKEKPRDIPAAAESPASQPSSWWSSILPSSSLVTSEVGKVIGQPATVGGPPLFKKVTPAATYTTVGRHGKNTMICHGYGSQFNSHVLSSRVSHAALREALDSEIGA